MKLGTKQISNKSLLMLSAILIIGLLSGTGGYFLGYDKAQNKYTTDPSLTPDETKGTTSQPTTDTSLPEGIISPTQVSKKPEDYLGKELKLKGVIVETGDNNFIIAGMEESGSGGIKLDLSGFSGDPKEFAISNTNSPVVVSGKTSNKLENFSLLVSAIDNN